jgi:hypothetical protein
MSEPLRPRRIVRSIVAVLAGVLAVIILSIGTDLAMHVLGVYPAWGQRMTDSLFLLATGYRVIYAVAGSYIAARLAPDRPMRHALVIGIVGLALGFVGAVATRNEGPEFGPKWYSIAIVAIAMPCAWMGGKLCVMQLRALIDG